MGEPRVAGGWWLVAGGSCFGVRCPRLTERQRSGRGNQVDGSCDREGVFRLATSLRLDGRSGQQSNEWTEMGLDPFPVGQSRPGFPSRSLRLRLRSLSGDTVPLLEGG